MSSLHELLDFATPNEPGYDQAFDVVKKKIIENAEKILTFGYTIVWEDDLGVPIQSQRRFCLYLEMKLKTKVVIEKIQQHGQSYTGYTIYLEV